MRRRICIGIGLASAGCWLALSSPSHAAVPLRVVYSEVFPPLSYPGPAREARGIFVDILKEALGRQLGVPLSHRCLPWKRAQQMVKNQEADAFCTSYTKEREAYTQIGREPMVTTRFHMYVSRTSPRLDALRQVRGFRDLTEFRLVVNNGNSYLEQMFESVAGLHFERVVNREAAFMQLALGRTDVYVDAEMTGRYAIRELGLVPYLTELPVIMDQVPLFFCARRDSAAAGILPRLDTALAALKRSSLYGEIFARYPTDPLDK